MAKILQQKIAEVICDFLLLVCSLVPRGLLPAVGVVCDVGRGCDAAIVVDVVVVFATATVCRVESVGVIA